jgi:SAM-dependent methyltransferase
MTEGQRNRPYKYLAQYYDRVFTPSVTAIQEAARQAVMGSILPRVQSACDLACGSGTTAVRLAKRGIRTMAVDNSSGMCRLVREKARRAGVVLRVLQADMRQFRLPERVDLVLCEGDAINHLDRKAELARVARCVARALRPGGWFYFDANNRAGFRSYWKDTWWSEKPGVVAVMRNGNDADQDRAWCDVEWFIRTGRGHWQRRHERVEEVCWSAREIRTILTNAGFASVRAWDASPYFKNPLITAGCRTLYLARRSPARRSTRRSPA